MKRILFILVLLVGVAFIVDCSSRGGTETGHSDAIPYANFGKTVSDAIPEGLRAVGAAANIATQMKTLTGTCAGDYIDCPAFSEIGGGDSATGEILMRLWAMDYNDECLGDSGDEVDCFFCPDCNADESGTWYLRPSMFLTSDSDDASICDSESTSGGRYVNFGIDPCFFDSMIAEIDNISECEGVVGGDVDISSAMPWYASWGVPQYVNFSGYSPRSEGGMWWTVNDGDAGNEEYYFSVSSEWIFAGMKYPDDNKFIFFGTGSPSYYEGREELGLEDASGINIAAYAGSLEANPTDASNVTFEALQFRDQEEHRYIERMKSKITSEDVAYIWYQAWQGEDAVPATPGAAVDAVKDSPTANRCVEVGSTVAGSKYVPLSDCVDAFGVADVATLNLDDNYILKIIDVATANSMNFDTPLGLDTTAACQGDSEEDED